MICPALQIAVSGIFYKFENFEDLGNEAIPILDVLSDAPPLWLQPGSE